MTRDEMQAMMHSVFAECQGLRNAGQQEYAHDESNALRNFEQVGEYLDVSRERVLLVYALKHLDGIVAYVNGHRSQREDVRSRIMVEDNSFSEAKQRIAESKMEQVTENTVLLRG